MAPLKRHHIKIKNGPIDNGVKEWESFITEVGGVNKVRIDMGKKF